MKPEVDLVESDYGNFISTISKCKKVLKKKQRKKFIEEAMESETYNQLLYICSKYVNLL